MPSQVPATNRSLVSLVKADGVLEISLVEQPMPEPKEDEVLVQVLAAPINPSDLFLLLPGADLRAATASADNGLPVIRAPMPAAAMRAVAGRVGQALPVGNEGCGVVAQAGSSDAAQALLGKKVAMLGGAMYAQYRCLQARNCLVLPDDTDPRDGASSFVNPLTSLGFVETMKKEGHKAIVHTAAASNLGQMLNRICLADGIPLINIVRSSAQVDLLKQQGASHVLNSTDPDFSDQLLAAIGETDATLAFDAIGGGALGSQILKAMETVAAADMTYYNRYGSDRFKQLYIYGMLDASPTTLNRNFGFQWSVSGWLLTHFLAAADKDTRQRMHKRVIDELTTTFASHYSHEISLEEALDPDIMAAYDAKKTGEKYLIRP